MEAPSPRTAKCQTILGAVSSGNVPSEPWLSPGVVIWETGAPLLRGHMIDPITFAPKPLPEGRAKRYPYTQERHFLVTALGDGKRALSMA